MNIGPQRARQGLGVMGFDDVGLWKRNTLGARPRNSIGEEMTCRLLAQIQVNHADFRTFMQERDRQMCAHGGLSGAALLVTHYNDARAQTGVPHLTGRPNPAESPLRLLGRACVTATNRARAGVSSPNDPSLTIDRTQPRTHPPYAS